MLGPSQPTDPSQPAPRGHVCLRAVDNVRGGGTVLLGVEGAPRGVYRDLGARVTVVVFVMDTSVLPFLLQKKSTKTVPMAKDCVLCLRIVAIVVPKIF